MTASESTWDLTSIKTNVMVKIALIEPHNIIQILYSISFTLAEAEKSQSILNCSSQWLYTCPEHRLLKVFQGWQASSVKHKTKKKKLFQVMILLLEAILEVAYFSFTI